MSRQGERNGQWFLTPLDDGRVAVGLVARDSGNGVLLGYFFGPGLAAPPALGDLESRTADDAILVGKFGHLGLRGGTWPVLGRTKSWSPEQWPVPVFERREELTGRRLLITYDEKDLSKVLRTEVAAPNAIGVLPKDGLMGAGFVELRLSKILT